MSNIFEKYSGIPISRQAPRFQFPDYRIIKGTSGAEYYYFPNMAQPLLSVRIIYSFDVGRMPTAGAAYFATQLLKSGTKSRSALQFAEEADAIGATFNFSSSQDDASCYFVALSEFADRALDLLIDAVSAPAFLPDETERLKKKHIAQIAQEAADPNYLCRLAFNSVYFAGHPYSLPLYGTEESISQISASEARRVWHEIIAAQPPKVIIAGNADAEPIIEFIENKLGVKGSSSPIEKKTYAITEEKKTRIIIADKASAPQTTLQFGRPAPPMLSPDYSAAQLANTLFGGYFMSALNRKIREEMGLTYGIYSYIANRRNGSPLIISSNLNKENTRQAIDCIIDEMRKFSTEPADANEIFTAQQYILGSFLRSTETPQDVANLIHACIVNGVHTDFYNQYYDFITKATPDSIAEAQKKYFVPEYLTISLVGPEDFLVNEIEGMGGYTLFVP